MTPCPELGLNGEGTFSPSSGFLWGPPMVRARNATAEGWFRDEAGAEADRGRDARRWTLRDHDRGRTVCRRCGNCDGRADGVLSAYIVLGAPAGECRSGRQDRPHGLLPAPRARGDGL